MAADSDAVSLSGEVSREAADGEPGVSEKYCRGWPC